jgi:anti-anti-sigma factor
MDISIRNKDNVFVIHVAGSLDIYTSLDFKNFLESNVQKENCHVVINLEKLTYIDSSGIGMLIKQLNYVQELNGKFSISNMKPGVEKVFKVAGLTSYFHSIPEDEFKQNFTF